MVWAGYPALVERIGLSWKSVHSINKLERAGKGVNMKKISDVLNYIVFIAATIAIAAVFYEALTINSVSHAFISCLLQLN